MPVGICTCGNERVKGSLVNLITEHSAADLECIVEKDYAKKYIHSPLKNNIIRSAESRQTILLESAGIEYKESLNELAVWLQFKWPIGAKIKVKFLNRDAYLEPLISKSAKEWEAFANITFEFIETGDSDVRISLVQDGTSWSKLGTLCTEVTDQNIPTMNFGWFNSSTNPNEIKRTTLHEFGHVLGCIHEHQSPDAKFPWDVNRIRRVYLAAHHKTEEWLQTNIIGKFPAADISNSNYDSLSIMHYPFDAMYTTTGVAYCINWDLSEQDKEFIGMCYPF